MILSLAELLCKRDNDTLGPADVGQSVGILVLHFANDLRSMGAQACDGTIDVVDGEHDATDPKRVHRRVHGPKPDRIGSVELVELDALPIWSPHHREGGPDILE